MGCGANTSRGCVKERQEGLTWDAWDGGASHHFPRSSNMMGLVPPDRTG